MNNEINELESLVEKMERIKDKLAIKNDGHNLSMAEFEMESAIESVEKKINELKDKIK